VFDPIILEHYLLTVCCNLNRIVQSVKPGEFRFYLQQGRVRFQKTLIGTAGFVVLFNLFGTGLCLAFKLHGGHKEIGEGTLGAVDPGKVDLEDSPLQAVIADIFTDNDAVFCSTRNRCPQTVVIDRAGGVAAQAGDDLIDIDFFALPVGGLFSAV
jgi:hypothetical protein